MTRSNAMVVVCVLVGVAATVGMHAAQAQGKPDCETAEPGRVTREIECRLNPSQGMQRLRFKAHFSGSHDDTTARMEAMLDGMPVACEDGSKTSTESEDGDVSLECRLSVKGMPDAKHVLRMKLRWHHAEYTGFDFDSD
ncbi:MAG: hypothetical protein ACKVQT_06405 [Burkholderiales bacterium]